jgi:hypothetical protein
MLELTPHNFVSKCMRLATCEKWTYQELFIDLCYLVGHHLRDEEILGRFLSLNLESRYGR